MISHVLRAHSVFGNVMLTLASCAVCNAQSASFQGVGLSRATALSADGSTVIGLFQSRWTAATGLTNLPDLPSDNGIWYPTAISADGFVVVGTSPFGAAVRWTQATGAVDLGSPVGFPHGCRVSGVSADGSLVVGRAERVEAVCEGDWAPYELRCSTAWRWSAVTGTMQALDPLPHDDGSEGSAISGDGTTTIGYSIEFCPRNCNQHGGGDSGMCVWMDDGPAVPLSISGGGFSYFALGALSHDGSVIVGHGGAPSDERAFRWTAAEGAVNLGVLPDTYHSRALDVSADGSIVVGISVQALPNWSKAFVWDEAHGLRSVRDMLVELGLNLTGWTLHDAVAVSADGRTIVGNGINPTGLDEAWIAFLGDPLPPCPGDVNGDDLVDLADLSTLLAHFGMASGATHDEGDLDGDEDVDLSDLASLLARFGAECR